jgi:RNA polymerase sigma-70 factor (ECF subfamily)
VSSTVLRGEGHTRITRWARWFPLSRPVADSDFQGPDDPYPGHWRRFPRAWPPGVSADADVRQVLREALEQLPPLWRDVVRQRDVEGRSGEDVAHDLGLSVREQRSILNSARAMLREQVADRLDARPDR